MRGKRRLSEYVPGYRPWGNGSRIATLAAVVAAHILALAALASLGAITVVAEKAVPLFVRMVPEPARPRIVEPVRPLQLPRLRSIPTELSTPPTIETLQFVSTEERRPPEMLPRNAIATDPAPAAPPALEPPRHDMAYLNNPAPSYPAVSRRTGEEGVVLLRVRVSAGGSVEAIEVRTSSGFARLDLAALEAVRRWRFVPARAGDRAVAGWALVPIHFTLRS